MRPLTRRLLVALVALWLASAPPLEGALFVTYESITVGAVAVGFSAATLDPVGFGQMTNCSGRVETTSARFRFDGTLPTTSEGVLLQVGDLLNIENHADARAIRFIATTGSGTFKAHCWR